MNDFILSIAEMGLSEQMRTACIVCAAGVAVLFSIWYGNKLGMNMRSILLLLLIAYPIDYLLLELSMMGTEYAALNNVLGIQTVVNSQSKTFVVIPFVALLTAKINKVEWRITADLLAVANLLNYAICSVGCIFTGCCIGYSCTWGLYSPTGDNAFPIQIVNAIIMITITIYLVQRSKKIHYIADGKQFPLMLIYFGITRFFSEFFMNNEKLAFGWSIVAYHCLFMVIAGYVALRIILKKQASIKAGSNTKV